MRTALVLFSGLIVAGCATRGDQPIVPDVDVSNSCYGVECSVDDGTCACSSPDYQFTHTGEPDEQVKAACEASWSAISDRCSEYRPHRCAQASRVLTRTSIVIYECFMRADGCGDDLNAQCLAVPEPDFGAHVCGLFDGCDVTCPADALSTIARLLNEDTKLAVDHCAGVRDCQARIDCVNAWVDMIPSPYQR
jgi:hypothetical protein